MYEQKEIFELLDLMARPGFCVRDGKIVKVNQAADGLFLSPGTEVCRLLQTGVPEYAAFQGGCLYLQLFLAGGSRGASVTRVEDLDIFLMEPESEVRELNAIALAARELRDPLSSLIAISDNLLPSAMGEISPKVEELFARMSKSLYQMQRILGNMSDAGHSAAFSCQETRNAPRVFQEIFEKAAVLLQTVDIQVRYEGLPEDILCLLDARQMERAVLNILSNSAKFMPRGGVIEAKLTRQNRFLQLSIQDSGSGIPENILSSIFSRYTRPLSLEDPRLGIGLGMVLVRSAATAHGGAVLIDQPGETGTRVTLTMEIRQSQDSRLHSLRTDITGGRDLRLIELSPCLPASVYQKER